MYMLIPMNFIILGNYVYVDSARFYNTCKQCWFYWILNACKLCTGISWILVNYVYVDSVRFYNTCELCICGFYWVLNACNTCGNYVYVDSNESL